MMQSTLKIKIKGDNKMVTIDGKEFELKHTNIAYKSQYQNYQKRENVFYQFREYKSPTRIVNIFHLRHYIFDSI